MGGFVRKFARATIFTGLLFLGCHADLRQGNPPRLATSQANRVVSLQIATDGDFADDARATVDWILSSNQSVVRITSQDSPTVFISTSGSPNFSRSCEVSVRTVNAAGQTVFKGTRQHLCGFADRHRDGLRATVKWALEESLEALGAGRSEKTAKSPDSASDYPVPVGKIARPSSVAVVVGIETYRRDLPAATGATSDARTFAAFAEKVLGVPPANIRILVDADATKSSIEANIVEWIPKNVGPAGDVFFFFAGHGAPEPTTGVRYLVPWDAEPKFISSQGLAISQVNKVLGGLRAAHVFAFFDACFSGSGGTSVLSPGTRPIVLQAQNVKISSYSNLSVFSAAGQDEVTGTFAGHGLFSHFLFKGLSGDADVNKDAAITFGELQDYVATSVADEARRQNREQRPSVSGPLLRAYALTRLLSFGGCSEWKRAQSERFSMEDTCFD